MLLLFETEVIFVNGRVSYNFSCIFSSVLLRENACDGYIDLVYFIQCGLLVGCKILKLINNFFSLTLLLAIDKTSCKATFLKRLSLKLLFFVAARNHKF